MKKSAVLVLVCALGAATLGVTPVRAAVPTIAMYDFNGLSGSDTSPHPSVHGQDGWTSDPYGTSVRTGVTASMGFDGTPTLVYDLSGPGFGSDASNLGGPGFTLPDFSGTETALILQGDFHIGTWGNQLAIGHDTNSDGKLRRTTPSELGPRLDIGASAGLQLIDATGVSHAVPLVPGDSTGGWMRLRVIMDLTANGGQGSGSVYKQNLTSHTSLQPVPGLQGINLALDPNATNGRNPALWNGVFSHFEGELNQLDNLIVGVDEDAPAITFNGNAGTYTLLQTVGITCTATDAGSGVADPNPCDGFSIAGPAWSFGAGPNTLPDPALVATDRMGLSSAPATTTFTVSVASKPLCTLTGQFVQSSTNYQNARPLVKKVVDALVSGGCKILTDIGPRVKPAQKATFIRSYQRAVQSIAQSGWLTQDQANTLATLSEAL